MQTQDQITLLLIEDDEQCARMVGKVLPQHGYKVHHANSGLLGLRLAREIKPQIILVDIGLPDLNGRVVMNQLRGYTANQSAVIIAFSAEAGSRAQRIARAFGCDGFIGKPIDIHTLHTQITEIAELAIAEGNHS